MRRLLMIVMLTAAAGCAPAPVRMAATEASELLERFAAGSAPADVCTPYGRALLRGAVRSYGAAMAQNGVAWPALPEADRHPDHLTQVEATVLVALAAGFVEPSDLRGPARALARQVAPAQWLEARDMRRAATIACADVMQLQLAASRVVLEGERYRRLIADNAGGDLNELLARQARRLERARTQMATMAALMQARLAANPAG